jgi:RNA polymerase sigma factor (sigma-70 family)
LTEVDRAYRKAGEGSPAAFADWLGLVELPLRRGLRRFARRVDVESVMQEGLLRLWILAPTLDLEGENASLRYAHVLMRNLAREEARRLSRQTRLDPEEIDLLPAEAIEPDPPPDPHLRRIALACIDRLPRRPREAILARIEGEGKLSDRALAFALKMTQNTFFQNITRARKLIARCLERQGIKLEGIR